ncbi:MAG: alpha-galactosidase [Planctomycetia bacterium]|nr:alpha-galactosidase [Planctomycetia bacterium]
MTATATALFTLLLTPWLITFDEQTSQLTLEHEPTATRVEGKLSFGSEAGPNLRVVCPRDSDPTRLALVNEKDYVVAYLTFQVSGDRVSFLVSHRTRQFFSGTLTYEATVDCEPDAFACRITPRKDENVLFLGSGPSDSDWNDALFSAEKDRALLLSAGTVNLATLAPGSFKLCAAGRIEESAEAVFCFDLINDYFKNRYVPWYSPIDRKRCPSPPTGWMSWNLYFDKATAEDNLAEARVGREYLQPYGMEFWSIESWQGNSDSLPVSNFYNTNLEVNEKQFPEGMKKLADDIRALGFRPGIWMAPFGTGNEEFYKEHRDWFLHTKEGQPMSTWNGRYTLDPTNAEVRAHWKKIFDRASHEWGYEFFKIDGMSADGPGYSAHFFEMPYVRAAFKDPAFPNPFEASVIAFREGIGPDRVFLACQGHASGPEAKYADASRIGSDIVHPNQPVKWANLMQQAGRTLNQIFTHNIVFFADPDTLLVNEALTLEEARLSTTVVSLPGQMMFAGDKLGELPLERMRLLQQTLPVADIHPMQLYPFFRMLPVWDLKVSRDFLSWDVVALFNWGEEEQKVGFDFKELGLSSDTEYLVYEFWTETFLGSNRDRFEMTVPGHGVRLLAVHKRCTRPQYVSSNRHITQGGVELKALTWNEESRTLSGTVALVAGDALTLRFYVPDGYTPETTTSDDDVAVSVRQESDGILAVTLTGKTKGEATFVSRFK